MTGDVRQGYAKSIAALLRASGVADYLYYDSGYTIIADKCGATGVVQINAFLSDTTVEIMVTRLFTGDVFAVTLHPAHRVGLIATFLQYLLQEPLSSAQDDSDAPHCCRAPMTEHDPEVLRSADGSPPRVTRVYTCNECDSVTRVEVTHPDEAEHVAQWWWSR